VTLPGTGNLSIGNCSGDMYALAYVRSTGEYVPVSELGSTMGEADAKEYLRLNAFWVYAFTACVMDFGLVQPTRMSELSLDEGWNFLPVTADMAGLSISDMRGCRFESVNAWDPAGQGWRIKDANEKFAGPPTIGFAAKVHEACRLGSINESTCMQGDCSE
jgi:hypothetical protein